jgi:hypothetical protein
MKNKPDPNCKWDQAEFWRLKPEQWMLDLLDLNPSYVHWGPYQDDMLVEDRGWGSRWIQDTWDGPPLDLDDWNEVVHFYFEINRDSEKCETCGGIGTHPDAQWISQSFYESSSPFLDRDYDFFPDYLKKFFPEDPSENVNTGKHFPSDEVLDKYDPGFREFCEKLRDGKGYWKGNLDDDDLKALEEAGRSYDENDPLIMDAISQHVVVKAKCKKWGIPYECPDCDGHGYNYKEEAAYVGLVLWVLHPRKGASKGMHIKRVEQEQLPEIFDFLREAAKRNAERFAKIPEVGEKALT